MADLMDEPISSSGNVEIGEDLGIEVDVPGPVYGEGPEIDPSRRGTV
jgi:hypothetical protein